MEVNIRDTVYKVMFRHARETYPNECCGFLYGNEGKPREIILARKIGNAKEGDQRVRFEISPEDYRLAEEYARNHKTQFLGIYHSHPDHPAVPSDYDLKRAFPYFSYIIVSLNKQEILDIRSWRLDENAFTEESLTKDLIFNC